MLLVSAEEHIDGDEDYVQALSLLQQALSLFREVGDSKGVADALRTVVVVHRARYHETYEKVEKVSDPKALEEATRLVKEELDVFRAAGNKYGEACMLNSLGEITLEQTSPTNKELDVAIDHAVAADKLFGEIHEAKLQSQACVTLSFLYLRRQVWKSGEASARRALSIAETTGDKLWHAKALHNLAVCLAQSPETSSCRSTLEEGLAHANSALTSFHELGLRKLEASELYFVATWLLMLGRARQALPVAKESMLAFKALSYGKGWQAESRTTVVRVLVDLHEWKEARKVAWEGINDFRANGDKRCLVLALDCLVHVHLEAFVTRQGDLQEAMEAAQAALETCRELADRKWEANQIFNMAQIDVRLRKWKTAEERVREATRIDEDLAEDAERAVKLQLLVDMFNECGSHQAALKVAQEVREIYRSKEMRAEEAHACLLVSKCYACLQEWDRALEAATEARRMSQKDADRKGEAAAWEFVSQVYRYCERDDLAEDALRSAHALQEQSGDRKAQAYALQHTASIHAAANRFEDAIKVSFEALALARRCGDESAQVEMLLLTSQAQLGVMMQRAREGEKPRMSDRDWDRAEKRCMRPVREAMVLARQLGDSYLVAGAQYGIAQVHLFLGRHDAGITAAREAQELWQGIDNLGGAAHAMLLVAQGFWIKSDLEAADDEVERALEVFKDLGDEMGMKRCEEAHKHFSEGPPRGPKERREAKAEDAGAGEASAALAALPAQKGMEVEEARKIAREVAFQAIGADEEIDLDAPLMDSGLDSLAAIAFREQLTTTCGLPMPTSLVFDYPSLVAIADHMVELSSQRR